jgi:hypothetical protein
MAAAIYRQQKVLSHFPVCCWIDWLLMIKNCLIESGTPCMVVSSEGLGPERDCSGKAQEQLYEQITDPSSRQRGCSTSGGPQLSDGKEKSGHEFQI